MLFVNSKNVLIYSSLVLQIHEILSYNIHINKFFWRKETHMERRKLKIFYEAADIDVISLKAVDIITTSGLEDNDDSSGGHLDGNWDVN